MKYWKDLACTIPAEDGDRVAAITEMGDASSMMTQTDPTKRPTVWIGGMQMNAAANPLWRVGTGMRPHDTPPKQGEFPPIDASFVNSDGWNQAK